MYVEEKNGAITQKIEGIQYYFCCKSCLHEFLAPEKELAKLRKFVIMGAIITILVSILTYLPFLETSLLHYTTFVLATPMQFWIGWRFYAGTIDAVKHRATNMDVLIAMGTTAAWAYSALVTFLPGIFLVDNVYFDTSTAIIELVLVGRLLEQKTKTKTGAAVRKLFDMQPKMARLQRDGQEMEVPAEMVRTGDILFIRPGDKIPVDGLVIEGRSLVDQSLLTGESMPVSKETGDEVMGGTINKNGLLKIKATNVGQATILSQIIRLVEDAKSSRVPLQRLADKVSSYFVPTVAMIAIGSALGWFFVGAIGLTYSLLAFVSVIIIACPCALGIATPAALMVGSGKAAENGILIKGGENLEVARKVNFVVFDKTGTLTEGNLSVTDVLPLGEKSSDEILRLAAISEVGSEHPLGQAIVKAAKERGLTVSTPDSFVSLPGHGVQAMYDRHEIFLGNRSLMKEKGIEMGGIDEKMGNLEKDGKTAIMIARRKNSWNHCSGRHYKGKCRRGCKWTQTAWYQSDDAYR